MATGLFLDYIGYGLAAERPAAPDLFAGALGFWFSTDTLELDVWTGASWTNVATAGGGTVTSVNGETGAVLLGINDLIDVLLPTSGEVPDQSILVYDAAMGGWVMLEPGAPNDVLTFTTAGVRWDGSAAGTQQYVVDGTPASDNTYTGRAIEGVNAGQTISQWQAVRMGSGGEWLIADAIGSGAGGMHGLAATAGTDNNPLTVVTEGVVRNDAWNWVVGGDLYLGESGALTQTQPSTAGDIVQKVGFAITADVIYLNVGDATLIEVV